MHSRRATDRTAGNTNEAPRQRGRELRRITFNLPANNIRTPNRGVRRFDVLHRRNNRKFRRRRIMQWLRFRCSRYANQLPKFPQLPSEEIDFLCSRNPVSSSRNLPGQWVATKYKPAVLINAERRSRVAWALLFERDPLRSPAGAAIYDTYPVASCFVSFLKGSALAPFFARSRPSI
jgi:hypothetical protein